MIKPIFRPVGGIVLACGLSISLACDSGNGRPRLPTQPEGGVIAREITLEGPTTIAPGTSVRFTLLARAPGLPTEDVSAQAAWSSSNPDIVSIDPTGVATARGAGDVRISAYSNRQLVTRELVAVPTGTFRLSGLVTEGDSANVPLSGAVVRVVSGTGVGLSTETGADGRYRLYGVAGRVALQVTRSGFVPTALTVDVHDHETRDIQLPLVAARLNVAGVYSLVISADGSCAERLSEPLRSRTYTATLIQEGPLVEARLSGAAFTVTAANRGDRLRGRVVPEGLRFVLSEHLYKYYGYAQFPDIAESVPQFGGWIVIDGTVTAAGTPERFAGMLHGNYQYFRWDPAWGGWPFDTCRGMHSFTLTRTR